MSRNKKEIAFFKRHGFYYLYKGIAKLKAW